MVKVVRFVMGVLIKLYGVIETLLTKLVAFVFSPSCTIGGLQTGLQVYVPFKLQILFTPEFSYFQKSFI